MTSFSLSDYQAGRGDPVVLASEAAAADGTGSEHEDFSGLDELTIVARAHLRASTSAGAAPQVTLYVEHSDDGDSWSTADSFVFTGSGSGRGSVATPKRWMRARWAVTAGEWAVRAEVVPAEVNVPGGSQPSLRVLGPFSFAHDTPGLNDGVTVYTPDVDEILMDAWIEVTEAFDGTTPQADIGTFVGSTAGLAANAYGFFDIGDPDAEDAEGDDVVHMIQRADTPSSQLRSPISSLNGAWVSGISSMAYIRVVPARFTAATPLKLVVSQDGFAGGAAIGGTTGEGKLYIVIGTPAALP